MNKRLQFEGWIVLRFWGEDIRRHLDECVRAVEEAVFDYMMNDDYREQ